MSIVSRIVRATNWKYALGEIALIFIGITLALAANNWYENRQDRIEESEILGQMIVSLHADVEDLDKEHSHVARKLALMTDLQNHISESRPYEHELDDAFTAILVGDAPQINTAVFETLKFRGVGLVSAPTLRNQIVDYYDTEVASLLQRVRFDSGDAERAVPYFNRNFAWSADGLAMTPLDYDSLIADTEFLNMLALRIWAYKNRTLGEYSRIEKKAIDLIAAIETHLRGSQWTQTN